MFTCLRESGSIDLLATKLPSVPRYFRLTKLVRIYLCPPRSSVASERGKNVVGDNRLRLGPDNLEINLFLKYKLRAPNYDIESLHPPPADFQCPNSLKKNPRHSDEHSEDERTNVAADSEDEDNEIEFSKDSDICDG